jgi:phage-related protein
MLNQQPRLRRIVWMGSSFDDLRQFPRTSAEMPDSSFIVYSRV